MLDWYKAHYCKRTLNKDYSLNLFATVQWTLREKKLCKFSHNTIKQKQCWVKKNNKCCTQIWSILISVRHNCWRRLCTSVTLSINREPYQFKHLKAMTWITSIHYMMCPWIEDSKINLGSRAGRGGNIWAEMLKSITALFFYSLKTVMHTKPRMVRFDDPSSSSEVEGLLLENLIAYCLLSACIKRWNIVFTRPKIHSNSVAEANLKKEGKKQAVSGDILQ